MEIKKYGIVTATRGSVFSETTLCKSLVNNFPKLWKNAIAIINNEDGLSKVYNERITWALENDLDCLILVHDDVILEEDPIPKLEKLFDDYDLVGVAGASKVELKPPALWHLMGGGFRGGNLHGCVQHTYQDDNYNIRKNETFFGPHPHRAVMIDGVFMALNRKAMETMRFDENCPSKFHFYDLVMSLSCHLAGLRVGVGDILITHESPGLQEVSQEWLDGETYFLKKYAN
jgi:hypothetical protein